MKIFFLTFILLLLPMVVFGQDDPNRGAGGLVPCSGTTCSACNFVQLANLLIDWLIGIITLLFAVLMVVAGFRLVTSGGNPSAKEAAKKSFTNAIIGFIIVLAAWVAVDTLMRTLLGDDGKVNGNLPWNEIQCAEQTEFSRVKYDIDVDEHVFVNPDSPEAAVATGGSGNRCTPIAESRLKEFPASVTIGGLESALVDTVDRFLEMRKAALADGIDLKIVDGYRPPEEQDIAWKQNGCKLVNGRASCAQRTAAVPCSMGGGGSNHTLGTAIDIRLTTGAYNWLKQNGSKYGFYNNLSNDKPHWSSTGR